MHKSRTMTLFDPEQNKTFIRIIATHVFTLLFHAKIAAVKKGLSLLAVELVDLLLTEACIDCHLRSRREQLWATG